MAGLSPIASQLIVILNNINDLIVVSNDRIAARDVMRAFRTYANNKNFEISEEKVNNFLAVLLDSRPITISYLIQDIAAEITKADRLKEKLKK